MSPNMYDIDVTKPNAGLPVADTDLLPGVDTANLPQSSIEDAPTEVVGAPEEEVAGEEVVEEDEVLDDDLGGTEEEVVEAEVLDDEG